jgi:NAD(P)-dependent dehydrogenase (short-subunit alcohol dehydrogenase family)
MDLSRFSMEGRTVIITGGSGGLGCARAFAQAGANVVIASLPAQSLPPAVAEIEALGVSALGVLADVTKPEQVDSMVQQTLDRFGRIDTLVNVAGGTYSRNPEMPQFSRAPLLELSPEDFMMAYEVNVKSAFLCSRAVVPHMKKLGKGAIINTGSESGDLNRKQGGEFSAYASAKAALHRLTAMMAYQWGRRCASTASLRERSTRLGRVEPFEPSWAKRRNGSQLGESVPPTISPAWPSSWPQTPRPL